MEQEPIPEKPICQICKKAYDPYRYFGDDTYDFLLCKSCLDIIVEDYEHEIVERLKALEEKRTSDEKKP